MTVFATSRFFLVTATIFRLEQPRQSRDPPTLLTGALFDNFRERQDRKLIKLSAFCAGDWRIFKKKKSLILPILILLNLIKLKLLLLPVFLGVHFIKKLLVLGSLILPSVLAHLKVCKVPHQTHPYHIWSTAAEATADYPSGKITLKIQVQIYSGNRYYF